MLNERMKMEEQKKDVCVCALCVGEKEGESLELAANPKSQQTPPKTGMFPISLTEFLAFLPLPLSLSTQPDYHLPPSECRLNTSLQIESTLTAQTSTTPPTNSAVASIVHILLHVSNTFNSSVCMLSVVLRV